MNYHRYHKARSEAARKRALAGWRTRHAAMATREPSADDLHARAIHDRRGEVKATLQVTNHASGRVTRLVLRHSVRGRADQFDVTLNGRHLTKPVGMVQIFKKWRGAMSV